MKPLTDTTDAQAGSALPITAELETQNLFSEYEDALGGMSSSSGPIAVPEYVFQSPAIRISVRAGRAPLFSDQTNVHAVLVSTVLPRAEEVSTDTLADEFYSLLPQWERETGFHSSLAVKFTHPAYQRIIGMGTPALPLILAEFKRKPGHWIYALTQIAGKDHAAEVGANTFAEAREAWLKWGHDNGYI